MSASTPAGINPQPRTMEQHMRNWQTLCAWLATALDDNGSVSVQVDDVTIENSGGSVRVKDLGIGTSKIAAMAVTLAKLGVFTTKGDIVGFDGSASALLHVAGHNDGDVLTISSSELLGFTWVTPAGGGGGSGLTKLTITGNSSGGTLLTRSGWTITASRNGGGTEANAIDGSGSTRWATGGSIDTSTDFFKIDTGSSHSIGYMQMSNPSAGAGDFPSTGNIQTSPDNVTYTTVASWTTADISGSNLTKAWTAAAARYVKLIPTATAFGGSGNWWSINEIDLADSAPGGSANLQATETYTGAAGKIVRVRCVIQRPVGTDIGIRVGADVNNWYGVLLTSGTIEIQKNVAGSTSTIGSVNNNIEDDGSPQVIELVIATPPTGSENWIVATSTKINGPQECATAADSSLTMTSGTKHFFGYAVDSAYFRGPGYSVGDTP